MNLVPTTMRASVLSAQEIVSVETYAVPVPQPDEVLIRVAAVGVCGSDVHYFNEMQIGDFVVEHPMVLGHEASGVIVAVGDSIDESRIGERVAIEPQRACRTCVQCKAGRYNLCAEMKFYATPPIDGAFAEYVVIQGDYAHTVPAEVSLEAAALCEPLSVAIWSHRKAGTTVGSRVLIAGAGPIGIVMAQVANAYGASEVIVVDPVVERRELALRFGATSVIDPITETVAESLAVDAFIDASGAAAAVRSGIAAVRPAGVVVLVGMGAPELTLPVGIIQNREIILTGVFRYANTYPLAIELVRSGAVDLDALVTGKFDLDHVAEALRSTSEPQTLKSIVVPSLAGLEF